jgi:hypothetical protein
LQDLGIVGRTADNKSYRNQMEVVDWIHVAKNRDHWKAYSNDPTGSIINREFLY